MPTVTKTITFPAGEMSELAGDALYAQLLGRETNALVNPAEEVTAEDVNGLRTVAVEIDDTVSGEHAILLREVVGDEVAATYFVTVTANEELTATELPTGPIQAGAAAALTAYDPPTKAEMDAAEASILEAVTGISGTVKYVSRVATQPIEPVDLIAYYKAGFPQEVFVEDEDGNPRDLSGKTLQFVLFRGETETEIAHVDEVTIGGADNNRLTWTVPATAHEIVGKHSYAVREPSNDQFPWAHGAYTIQKIAGPHV